MRKRVRLGSPRGAAGMEPSLIHSGRACSARKTILWKARFNRSCNVERSLESTTRRLPQDGFVKILVTETRLGSPRTHAASGPSLIKFNSQTAGAERY